jgi:hypothetical protein
MDIESKLRQILMLNKFKYCESDNDDTIKDVTNGVIYRRLLNSEDGHLFKNNKALSFRMNTDAMTPPPQTGSLI